MILVTSSFLVFGVILFLFKEFRVAFLILVIAVLGIAGSYLASLSTNTPLNVGSLYRLMMIVGIIGEKRDLYFCNLRIATYIDCLTNL